MEESLKASNLTKKISICVFLLHIASMPRIMHPDVWTRVNAENVSIRHVLTPRRYPDLWHPDIRISGYLDTCKRSLSMWPSHEVRFPGNVQNLNRWHRVSDANRRELIAFWLQCCLGLRLFLLLWTTEVVYCPVGLRLLRKNRPQRSRLRKNVCESVFWSSLVLA